MINNDSSQSRKYHLTINNYDEYGFSVEAIKSIAESMNPDYFCLSEEVGKNGTPHVHLYMQFSLAVRFSTIKKRFPTAHIEAALGSAQSNRDYIRKEGKYADSDKAETRVDGSFFEWGAMKPLKLTRAQTMPKIIALLRAGKTTLEIISQFPEYAFKGRDIDTLREEILAEKYMNENRDVTVHYVYGATAFGKTSGIFKAHDSKDICRITDYSGSYGVRFDAYHGHKVLVLEEFHSQIDLPFMLNLLDRYPLMLPARYMDSVACYNEVYLTSNEPLENQYHEWKIKSPETYKAFRRRITDVTYYGPFGPEVIMTRA